MKFFNAMYYGKILWYMFIFIIDMKFPVEKLINEDTKEFYFRNILYFYAIDCNYRDSRDSFISSPKYDKFSFVEIQWKLIWHKPFWNIFQFSVG